MLLLEKETPTGSSRTLLGTLQQCKFVALAVAGGLSLLTFAHLLWKTETFRPSHGINWATSSKGRRILESASNGTLGFAKIYALNMPERGDKRDSMSLAASLTGLNITYIPGVNGSDIPTKALPLRQENRPMKDSQYGSWRAHMDAIREIVERNYSSALIIEDDVDWDLRIQQAMPAFALGVHHLMNETNPPTTPGSSPYGGTWDLLWLGHCKDRIPKWNSYTYALPPDPMVPPLKHIDKTNQPELQPYPPHTRLVHFSAGAICTYAYALSQTGARKILYALSVKELRGVFDNALADWCKGLTDVRGTCVSADPPYFFAHRFAGGAGKGSDIQKTTKARAKGETWYLQWSAKMNAAAVLNGVEPVNQYPDDKKG